MSPARLRPQHTALLAAGPQVPRRVSVGCRTRAELSPSRPAFAGSETPLGLQQTEAPPRGAAGALADLRHGLRPLATRAEGPDPLTTLNGWAAGSWRRVERDCWCGWPRAGTAEGAGVPAPRPAPISGSSGPRCSTAETQTPSCPHRGPLCGWAEELQGGPGRRR